MDEDDKKDLVSCYLNSRLAYESRGGDKFDFPTEIHFTLHSYSRYDAVKKMTSLRWQRMSPKHGLNSSFLMTQ
ncbi:MAG: hypothetical protein ACLS9K_02755 [Lachnospira eligens]